MQAQWLPTVIARVGDKPIDGVERLLRLPSGRTRPCDVWVSRRPWDAYGSSFRQQSEGGGNKVRTMGACCGVGVSAGLGWEMEGAGGAGDPPARRASWGLHVTRGSQC